MKVESESNHESLRSVLESNQVTSHRGLESSRVESHKVVESCPSQTLYSILAFTLKSESKIKISLSIIYLSYFNLLDAEIFKLDRFRFDGLWSRSTAVAKWLERDSTWLVRVKGSSSSRVACLRGPWLESCHESQKCDESRVNTSVL